MKKKLQMAVAFLKKTSAHSILLGFILSIIANMLTCFIIPGSGAIETIIAIVVSIITIVLTIKEKTESNFGLIESIHAN